MSQNRYLNNLFIKKNVFLNLRKKSAFESITGQKTITDNVPIIALSTGQHLNKL